MKRNKLIYLIVIGIALSSCTKWLTVKPKDQVNESELYSKADGFYTQINGLYRSMAEAQLYGRELSFGLIEVVAQTYDTDSRYSTTNISEYKNAANYGYLLSPRLKTMIDKVWESSYNVIANCNSIISYANSADSMLFPRREMERKSILGEAYAVRALLHFDILRLFAPSLSVNETGSFVPYNNQFPTHIPRNITSQEFIENVIKDLLEAEELTAALDTIPDFDNASP